MKVQLAYGDGRLEIDLPEGATVITPHEQAGLADEAGSFRAALESPTGTGPLRERVGHGGRICIVFTDITRATPNERIIPWLLDYLHGCGVTREQITLLNALGTHRPNTHEELCKLLTPQVVRDYRVLNHEPENAAELVQVGLTGSGAPASPPLANTVNPVTVYFGGGFLGESSAVPSYAGLAPNYVGLYQINVTIPPYTPLGNVPVMVELPGHASNFVEMAIIAAPAPPSGN